MIAPSVCARALRWTLWPLSAAAITSACSGPEFTIKPDGAADAGTSGKDSTVAGEGAEGGTVGAKGGGGGASGRAGSTNAMGGGTNGGRGGSGATAGAPQSSGRGGTGGARAGTGGAAGRSAQGGSGGEESGTGGLGLGGLGLGGLGLGGLGFAGLGASGGAPSGFPATGVLDDFNREGPELGNNWTGSASDYSLVSKQLACGIEYCPGVFWDEEFGPAQEVFATLASFLTSTPEINLVLKAQGDPHCDMIELLYSAEQSLVLVEGCWDGGWRSLGAVAMSLEPGDQLGGRSSADGRIEMFKNGSPSGTVDASAYPYLTEKGLIGVNGVVAPGDTPNAWDDFGGGGL